MSDSVMLTITDGVAQVTLNRPRVLNALDLEMATALLAAVTEALESPETRAIVLNAEGPAFCAGGDVNTMQQKGSEYVHELARRAGAAVLKLVESSVPVVAAVHGAVVGGGLGIVLASDIAVAAKDSRIGGLYTNIGMTPDLSASTLLREAVGERRALELLMTPRLLSGDEARDWGLVTESLDRDNVLARALEIGGQWASTAPQAIGEAKRLVRSSATRSLAQQLEEEARTIAASVEHDEAQQLMTAFLSSRRGNR